MQRSIALCLIAPLGVSILGYVATLRLTPIVATATLTNGLHGRDVNKAGTEAGNIDIPEAVGLAPAGVYLACIVILQLYSSYCNWCSRERHPHDSDHTQRKVAQNGCDGSYQAAGEVGTSAYNAVLATVGMMTMIGLIDDVLHPPSLAWSMKALLPFFAVQPILVPSYLRRRPTAAVKPVLQRLLGAPARLDFSIWYYIYLNVGTMFVPNSINILAGINGLEAGQTFIVSCAVLLHNLMHLATAGSISSADEATVGSLSLQQRHFLSISLIAPLAATTLAILHFNWYPSQVFVGDTFTFFAGTVIAAAAVFGQYTGTLFIFLLPQFINAMYTLPQLFKFIPYPRHRLPEFNPSTGLLHPKSKPDLTLLSLILQWCGPCTEQVLCIRLLLLQVACCAWGLWLSWRRCCLRGNLKHA